MYKHFTNTLDPLKNFTAIVALAALFVFAFTLPESKEDRFSFVTGIDTLLKEKDKTKKEFLEMRGVVMQSKTSEKGEAKLLDSAFVKIYDEKKKLLVMFMTKKNGKCDVRLPLNSKFIIEVSHKGYVTKFLEVNSKVPDDKRAAFIFPFTIDIFEAVKGLDVSALKKPIAKVNYSFGSDHFSYDFAYTDRINNELKKMYKNYYFLQTVENDLGADSLDTQKQDTLKKKTPKKH